MKLGLITLILSLAALAGVLHNQSLYYEALGKIDKIEATRSVSKNGSTSIQPLSLNDFSHEQISEIRKPPNSTNPHQEEHKTLQLNHDSERFYAMFKDAMNRYEKEMKEKYNNTYSKQYMKSRLNRYKKRLNINDIQWQFVEPILTEYLEKLDQLRIGVFQESEEDYENYWQRLSEQQQKLKDEYAKKLTPYLTNQQIDSFKNILIL